MMNDIRFTRWGTLVLVVLGLATTACGVETLYVSTVGNDAWSGRLAAPNGQGTDGPLATLGAARDRLRSLRAERTEAVPMTVRVRGGDYFLAEPLVLQPVDSGTADAPVVYEAAEGETPVLSGGTVITGMQQRGTLWEVEIPEVKAGHWYFRQLFVSGQRRTRARAPNAGYYRIAERLPGPPDSQGQPFARDRFVFADSDLQPWERLADVNVVLVHSWETSLHPLRSVDPAARVVEFAAPLKEWWCIGYWEPHQRYYAENARELLDEPGEWYLNRETGVLSYWPLPGETREETVVIAPRLTELVRLAGDPDRGQFVDHVTLRGLSFHHNDWVLAPTGNSSTQAAVEVPAAVMADGARHCRITSCEVAHVGTYGIWLRRGCKTCCIERTRLFDLGAGGIRVGEATMAERDEAESSGNIVDNNHIYDGGRVYAGGIGIWVAQSSHNRLSNNDIHDLYYTGISIGWNWDDAPNRTHHNVIERNHVHHLGHGVLSDAGLIYCLGVSPGSVIRNNVFHDMWPYSTPPFGWGIYLDATCAQYLVENNVVYNTLSGGLMYNNGGHEHVIQNNIFAMSANHALWPVFPPQSNTFRRNIVYVTQGELFIPLAGSSLEQRLAAGQPLGEWNRNLYWHADGADRLRFVGRDWAGWQALGLDRDSLIADPRFEDVATRNFQLTAGSPAFAIDFRPINVQEVGLYGDARWVSEASHTRCAVTPLPPPPPPLTVRNEFEDLQLSDMRVRDPFVLADAATGTYYLYAQMDNRIGKDDAVRGVEVYTSQDLEMWHGPEPVFVVPEGFWANWMVWAPEVHRYRDKYYLFVTFTSRELLEPQPGRPPLHQRGTQILVADSPRGPFRPFENRAHTPADWMALDGTLWVEDGVPWMVFCHEWVQTIDGTMELVRLTDDLAGTVGAPRTLFRATDAKWVRPLGTQGGPDFGYVTDGPFLYRTRAGKLVMIWSSFGDQQYAVGCAVSTTGSIAGPWEQLDEPLFAADGGHGMIFRTFNDRLMLALHQPNSGNRERARFFQLKDVGDRLEIE